MNRLQHDINDDEIRIISSRNTEQKAKKPEHKVRRKSIMLLSVTAAAICLAVIIYALTHNSDPENFNEELELVTTDNSHAADNETSPVVTDSIAPVNAATSFVNISDTTVNGVNLSIFTPVNATPSLHIGPDILNDSTATFIVQAADVREDNGGIVGTFVMDGELISKGQAKSGFCAIIGGKAAIGVAEATPLLEQALENNGYFFRQYPLVVANQLVENKPKGMALRKALVELNGSPAVIMSKKRMTFHDFSQSLVDLGVTNAIYLVGSTAYGYAIDRSNNKVEFGEKDSKLPANTNYMVWQ